MLPAGWLRRFDGGVFRERPLAPLTTWRIGGPAELFLEPDTVDALVDAVSELRRRGVPCRILGGGSNLLIPDRGVRGAVVSLARLDRISRRGRRILAEGGAKLHWLVRFAASAELSGAECLAGIPGSVGGALFGNAGGRHGDIGGLVRSLELIDAEGRLRRIEPEPGFFFYRGSGVGDRIVVRAELELDPAPTASVRGRNLEVIRERRSTQPGWVGNAGCVFRNPAQGSAGRLIDSAGCKRLREGGIRVSERHANFFLNDGTGTADDVRRLVERVRERVRDFCGVDLEMEVRQWD